jgi:uncharacterized phage-associated protein
MPTKLMKSIIEYTESTQYTKRTHMSACKLGYYKSIWPLIESAQRLVEDSHIEFWQNLWDKL